MIGGGGRADAGAFLARLLRLDPAAVVRIRPVGRTGPLGRLRQIERLAAAGRMDPAEQVEPEEATDPRFAEFWGRLPFGVLVGRVIRDVALDDDLTVAASALLRTLDQDPPRPLERRDAAWRWALPTSRGRAVETIPANVVARVAAAASQTLRVAVSEGVGGRAVGERALRDALLDHVPIVATSAEGDRVEVSQRLVQAVARMNFLGTAGSDPSTGVTNGDTSITVRRAGSWICLDASYGSAWYRPVSSLGLS